MNDIKILLVVEGENTENGFLRRLTELYGVRCKIYTVGTNLFALYDKMKKMEFQCDIKEILREFNLPEEQKSLLREDFAYTYLVCDGELQDKRPNERNVPTPLETRIQRNIDKLIEMTNFSNDETDPSKGKLYINYPMMESYRDSDIFYDEQFIYNVVPLGDIPKYKSIVARKKLSGYDISKYSKDNFICLMRTHVRKLAFMLSDNDYQNLSYSSYLTISSGDRIALAQKESIIHNKTIHVLNSSVFFLLDYYGNRDGFYDSVIHA